MDQEQSNAELFDWICRKPSPAAAISGLNPHALRNLYGYLSRMNVESGIPGLIRGLVITEAADRYLTTPSTSDV